MTRTDADLVHVLPAVDLQLLRVRLPGGHDAQRWGDLQRLPLSGGRRPGLRDAGAGGYCDPNGNGEFSDADWVRGWQEYQAACT